MATIRIIDEAEHDADILPFTYEQIGKQERNRRDLLKRTAMRTRETKAKFSAVLSAQKPANLKLHTE